MRRPQFLDVEASSLDPGSYPIEIGWSTPDGEIEAYLIRVQEIAAWTDWDPVAQHQVHGLSRAQLFDEGRSPFWLARS